MITVLNDLVPQAAPFLNHGIAKLRRHWVALAQSSPSVLYSCITSAVTNKSLVTGDLFADPVTQRKSSLILDRLRNRGETISLINRDLSSVPSATSDACISAVSMLISIEVWFPKCILVFDLTGYRLREATLKILHHISMGCERWFLFVKTLQTLISRFERKSNGLSI